MRPQMLHAKKVFIGIYDHDARCTYRTISHDAACKAEAPCTISEDKKNIVHPSRLYKRKDNTVWIVWGLFLHKFMRWLPRRWSSASRSREPKPTHTQTHTHQQQNCLLLTVSPPRCGQGPTPLAKTNVYVSPLLRVSLFNPSKHVFHRISSQLTGIMPKCWKEGKNGPVHCYFQ